MFGGNQVPDKILLKKVTQRLLRAGSQGKVQVAVRNGQVTLSGMLQYANQRRPIVSAAGAIEGVRSVIDQLQLKAQEKRRW